MGQLTHGEGEELRVEVGPVPGGTTVTERVEVRDLISDLYDGLCEIAAYITENEPRKAFDEALQWRDRIVEYRGKR